MNSVQKSGLWFVILTLVGIAVVLLSFVVVGFPLWVSDEVGLWAGIGALFLLFIAWLRRPARRSYRRSKK